MTIQDAFNVVNDYLFKLNDRISKIEYSILNSKKEDHKCKCTCFAHHYVGQCFQKDFPNCPCHLKEKTIEFCKYHKNLKPCVRIHSGKIVCSSTPCHIKERE